MINEREILRKLKKAWKMGCTDAEACIFAQITPSQLKDIYKYNPDLAGEVALLRERPKALARKNVVDAIEKGDTDTSKWYLSHKAKEEFGTGQKTQIEITSNLDEKLESLDKFLENFGKCND